MKSLGMDVPQCSQASDEFHNLKCCPSDKADDGCDSGGWPEFDKHNVTYKQTKSSPLQFRELKTEIGCRRQPIAFSWKWANDNGGHMMVAIGYTSVNGEDLVEVNDPWMPRQGSHKWISYSTYVAASDHTHWDDFYHFAH